MEKMAQGAKRLFFQARMTSFSMIMAALIYGGLGYYLVGIGKLSPVRPDEQVYAFLKYGAFVLSVVIFVLTRKTTVRMLDIAASRPGPRSPQKLFIASILMNASVELAAVFGLILLFLSGEYMDFLPFAALSAAGFTLVYPRRYQWAAWLGEDL